MPEPCWQRAGCCCCCLAAACGPQAGLCSCCSAQLSSAQHTPMWSGSTPGITLLLGASSASLGWRGLPQTTASLFITFFFGAHWKVPLLLKQWDWRKGNKFEDFYILRVQMHILHKPELLIPEITQSGSWLLIRSGPTFVWYWQSHLSAMKSWQNLPDSPLLPTSSIAQVELFYQLLWVCMRPLVWPVWEIRAKQGIMDAVELILAITES